MGDLEEEVDEEEREQEEDLYYSSLLDSKLDSCPQQPFNEPTNRLWNAVYSQVQRKNRVEMMSRWEQIQRGYISQEQISSAIHIERKMINIIIMKNMKNMKNLNNTDLLIPSLMLMIYYKLIIHWTMLSEIQNQQHQSLWQNQLDHWMN